jgi:hypothetical protein
MQEKAITSRYFMKHTQSLIGNIYYIHYISSYFNQMLDGVGWGGDGDLVRNLPQFQVTESWHLEVIKFRGNKHTC